MPASRDLVIRILGVAVGIGLGAATALWEAVLTPTYIGPVRSPLAPIAALVGNALIVMFTYFVTRHVGLALLPGAAWLIVMFVALTRTSEGDLIVTGTWVGGTTFLAGCLGWAGTGYYLIMARAALGRKRAAGRPGAGAATPLPEPGKSLPKKPGTRTKSS